LVHFLYTGKYETICSQLDIDTSDLAKEYRKSLLVYQASRTYGLTDLEALAKYYVEHLGEEMSTHDILRITRDVFSKLPEGETWLPSYIEKALKCLLKPGNSEFDLDDVYKTLGHDHHFDNTVMKMMVQILSAHLRSWGDALKDDGKGHRDLIKEIEVTSLLLFCISIPWETLWANGRYTFRRACCRRACCRRACR
jgi:hypothetical protein